MNENKKGGVPVLGMAVVIWFAYLAFIKFVVRNVPASVVLQYMILCALALVMYFTVFDDDLDALFGPITRFLAGGDTQNGLMKLARLFVLVAVPVGIGFNAYNGRVPNYTPPQEVRTVHPAPPTMFAGMANPLQGTDMEKKIGFGLFVAYCSPCHGNKMDGNGPAAYGWNPKPIDFTDKATISQLQLSFVFWRIKKGGIGMPVEGQPWNSVMPRWEGFGRVGEIAVPDDQIWMLAMYLYEGTGQEPRSWDEE